MHIFKTVLLASMLAGVAALSSLAWADSMTGHQSSVRSMNQEQIQIQQRQTPTAADFERLNNRNESRTMNKQSNRMGNGAGTGVKHQYQHEYRYGSGSLRRGGTGQGSRGR